MAFLNKIDLDALELQFGRGLRLSDEAIERISKAAEDNGIALSAHAPYYINLNSLNPETIEKSKGWILDTVEVAQKTNASIVVVHAGRRGKEEEGDPTAIISKGFKTIMEEMEKKGWDTYIGIETMGKEGTWGTLEEIERVCRISKLFVPVIDFAHIHSLYNGHFKTQRDYEKVLQSYEELDTGFLHCHFTSVEYGPKGEKKHLPVETRDPDFLPLAKALKKKDYRVRLICESPLLEEDALQLKEWYDSV